MPSVTSVSLIYFPICSKLQRDDVTFIPVKGLPWRRFSVFFLSDLIMVSGLFSHNNDCSLLRGVMTRILFEITSSSFMNVSLMSLTLFLLVASTSSVIKSFLPLVSSFSCRHDLAVFSQFPTSSQFASFSSSACVFCNSDTDDELLKDNEESEAVLAVSGLDSVLLENKPSTWMKLSFPVFFIFLLKNSLSVSHIPHHYLGLVSP